MSTLTVQSFVESMEKQKSLLSSSNQPGKYIVCRPEMRSYAEVSRLPIITSDLTRKIQTKFPRANKKKVRITKKFKKKYTILWPDYSLYIVEGRDFND